MGKDKTRIRMRNGADRRNGYEDKTRSGYEDKTRSGYGDKTRSGYEDKTRSGYGDKTRMGCLFVRIKLKSFSKTCYGT